MPLPPGQGVRLLHEDAHLAVVYKPSGVAVRRAPPGPQRSGPPVEAWARTSLSLSPEADATAFVAHSSLERAVAGLLPVSKTARAAALLAAHGCRAELVAVVTAKAGLELLRVPSRSTVAPLDTARALAAAGTPVLGVNDGTSGAHLALLSLSLPPELSTLRGPLAPVSFEAPVPARFAKALTRRAALEARLVKAAQPAAAVRFSGLLFSTGGGAVLAPRPSSELLVAVALARCASGAAPALLDLGCGSGALLLSVLANRADAVGDGVDLDPAALAVTAQNAATVLGAGWASRLALHRGDFGQLHQALRPLLREYDVILCNPPYFRSAALAGAAALDPAAALDGGADGLRCYADIAASLTAAQPQLLTPQGVLVLQLPGGSGPRGVSAVVALFAACGWVLIREHADGLGRVRCVELRLGA